MSVQLLSSKGKGRHSPNSNRLTGWMVTGILGLSLGFSAQAATIFVSGNASGSADGSSWEHAYTDLQQALTVAETGDEIWVAAGVYKPVTPSDVNNVTTAEQGKNFALKSGVALYGGFTGVETSREQRDWQYNRTILSGDLDDNDDGQPTGRNSYRVVKNTDVNDTAVLDGFILTGGLAQDEQVADSGAGIFNQDSSPTIRNVILISNYASSGGGMYNTNSSPILHNVMFIRNYAYYGGAGMLNWNNSNPVLQNAIFVGNRTDGSGGAISNSSSAPELYNVTFSANHADQAGGAISNSNSNPSIYSSIFWGNRVGTDIGTASASVFNNSSTPTFAASMVQGCNPNGTWNASCGTNGIQELLSIGNTPDTDPLFVAQPELDNSSSHGNLRLTAASPLINAAEDILGVTDSDIVGNQRIVGNALDLGAYEYVGNSCPVGGVVYVDRSATEPGNGFAWGTAFRDLQDALLVDEACQIHVAEGVYKPTTTNDRTISFELKNNVALYGGFPAGGGDWPERDWQTHRTILSGDIDHNDITEDGILTGGFEVNMIGNNSYHVVLSDNTNTSAKLDGFIITAGSAYGTSGDDRFGGGILNRNGSPVLTNLALIGNRAISGGGMYDHAGNPRLSNILFIHNGSISGGGIYTTGTPELINVVFSGNIANTGGGAYVNNSSPSFINTSFSGNFGVTTGGAITNWGASATPSIQNSIFWNNGTGSSAVVLSSITNSSSAVPVIEYSLIQHCNPEGVWDVVCGTDGGDNLADANPLFLETPDPATAPTAAGNLRLAAGSPAIDAGDSGALIGVLTDLDGNNRIQGDAPDLGAYESTPVPDSGDTGGTGDDGDSASTSGSSSSTSSDAAPVSGGGGGGAVVGFGLLGLLGMAVLGRRRLLQRA